VGFVSQKISLNGTSSQIIDVKLESNTQLQEVIIYAPVTKNINIASLTTKELEQIPSLSGKVDIGKSLQFLPGISTQKEGSSLLLVRGGDPGQNMYLFDNVSVLHVNHLGGFMSAFNPDIINAICKVSPHC